MALVTCPDCHQSISNVASACPQCGRPRDRDGARVATQLTATPIKAAQAVGVLLTAFGLYGLATDAGYGIAAAVLGVLLYLGARLTAWWHHG